MGKAEIRERTRGIAMTKNFTFSEKSLHCGKVLLYAKM